MKIKFSWIPFIPVAVLSIILRVYQKFFIDMGIDTGFISTEVAWVAYTALIALLFLVLIILSCADRKTSPYYKPGFNLLAGLFGVVAAAIIIFNSGVTIGGIASDTSSANAGSIIDALFGVVGGCAILIMAISSFSGKNLAKKIGIFSIAAPLWCCVRLVTTFISYKEQSVHAIDMTNLFFMSFMTLALFHLALIYQGIACKNPVKSALVYGMPAFIITIVYAVANAIDQVTKTGNYDIMGSLDIISFVLLAFYILFMLIELTGNAVEKEEIEPISEENDKILNKDNNNKDEIQEEEAKMFSANHVDITDVDDNVNEELDNVDDVIDAMEKEDKDPEKLNPLSQEYFDSKAATVSENDEISQSLAEIDKLINEINAE